MRDLFSSSHNENENRGVIILKNLNLSDDRMVSNQARNLEIET